MNSIFHKTLALTLSVSMLVAYTPGFAAETTHMDITTDIGTLAGDTYTVTDYDESGGAIFISNTGKAIIEKSNFTNNSAYKKGGAIYNEGILEIQAESSFTGNTTTWDGAAGSGPENTNSNGGAIWNSGTLILGDNITFKNNQTSHLISSGNGHGSDIYNYDGNVTVGNNTTFTRDELSDYHDCSIFLSGGTLTMGDNITFSKVREAIVTSREAQVTIGDNLLIDDVSNGIASWGQSVNIGKNATFSNILGNARAFQTVTAGGSFSFGDGLVVKDNTTSSFGNVYNEQGVGSMSFLGKATFTNNKAWGNAGVFQNWSKLYFNGETTFDGNISNENAGALRNRGTDSYTEFNDDVSFSNNKAAGNGGAIENQGYLVFNKNVTFSDNYANAEAAFEEVEKGVLSDGEGHYYTFIMNGGNKNDIHNIGTIDFNGTATLDGGITGTGNINVNGTLNIAQAEVAADTIVFANGSTLGVEFGNNAMGQLTASTVQVGKSADDSANLVVTLSRDFLTTSTTEHTLTDATVQNGKFSMADVSNALYNVSFDDSTNVVTAQRKSQEEQQEAVEKVGGTANDVAVTAAFTSESDLGNDTTNKVADLINTLAQTDTAKLVEATKAVAPEVAPAKQVVHTAVLNEVFGALQHRMADAATASPAMYALGDAKDYNTANTKHFSVWTQGLLNKSHKEATSDTHAFTGRSTGIAAGADMKVGESGLVGLGYAYTHTNVSSTGRHDRILGDNFFLYGQYRPSAFYVQGSMAYGDSKYEESKYLPGMTLDADYHVQHYAMQGRVGYDVTDWFSPNMGLRYTRLHQEGYSDGAQNVSADNSNYFTGMLGADFQLEQRLSQHVSLLPHLYTGLSYDFKSDDNNSRVTLPNATGYNVTGERLHRLAFEVGAGVTARFCHSVEAVLGYEGSFREDYNSHTGTLKLRYLF